MLSTWLLAQKVLLRATPSATRESHFQIPSSSEVAITTYLNGLGLTLPLLESQVSPNSETSPESLALE
jgi:hypothetical protein